MLKKIKMISVAAILTLPIYSFSWASFTGTQILDVCKKEILFHETNNSQYISDANVCSGYIAGVASAMLQNLPDAQADCYGKYYIDVTGEQLARVAIKVLQDHPQYLNYDASGSLVTIFWADFPMPKKCLAK